MYIAKRKRIVRLPDREIDFGDFYLTDFIQPDSYASEQIALEGWDRLIDFYRKSPTDFVTLINYQGLFNMYVKSMWNLVNVKIKYRYDDPVFQTPDFWLVANECWKQQMGDCEDTTFTLLSPIYREKRLWEGSDPIAKDAIAYGCIGFYISQGQPYGHGFIIYKSPKIIDRWLWIETTLEEEVNMGIWFIANFNQLIPVYFFTDKECYRIDKDYKLLGLDQGYVSMYKSLIDMMINYVETGKWTKVKWMHKTQRPATITPSSLFISC